MVPPLPLDHLIKRSDDQIFQRLRDKVGVAQQGAIPKRKFQLKSAIVGSGEPAQQEAAQSLSNLPNDADSASSVTTGRGHTALSLPEGSATQQGDILDDTAPQPTHPELATIVALSDAHWTCSSENSTALSALISDTSHSLIDLRRIRSNQASLSSLTLRDVRETLTLGGVVSGAVHITHMCNSVLVVNSHQIRLHMCQNCAVYLRCSSKPIIEECKDIKFAPLPAYFVGTLIFLPRRLTNHGTEQDTNLEGSENLWNQINDFGWPKAGESPNWSTLRPKDDGAIAEDDWRELCSSQARSNRLNVYLALANIP